tara:strand:+ start:908 stop:1198 length:291 start_codon:yes stop_codon:yes gene_type:complete
LDFKTDKFSSIRIINTNKIKTEDNWIAEFISPNENQDLKIPVVNVLTPKYFTAPYSFKTSIITKNNPAKIAGLESGRIIFQKVLKEDKPKFLEISK